MQYQVQTQSQPLGMRISSAAASLLAGVTARYKHYRVYRNTLNELQNLSDRDLNDLGLGRGSLRATALEAANATVKF